MQNRENFELLGERALKAQRARQFLAILEKFTINNPLPSEEVQQEQGFYTIYKMIRKDYEKFREQSKNLASWPSF